MRKLRRVFAFANFRNKVEPVLPRFLSLRRKWLFGLLMLLAFVQVGLAVAVAGAMDGIFTDFSNPAGKSAISLPNSIGMMAVLLAAIGLGEFLRRWLTEALGLDYAQEVRLKLFERHLRKPFRGTKDRSRGNVLLPFVGDLTALRSWWADGVARGCSAAAVATGLCIYLLFVQPVLGAVMTGILFSVLVAFASLSFPYAKSTQQQRRQRGALTGHISDRIAAAHSIYALGGLQRELLLVQKKIEGLNRFSLARARWSGLIRAIAAIAPVAASALAIITAQFDATASHGVVGALLLAGLLGTCISDLARSLELAIPGKIAMRRIQARLAEIRPLRRGASQSSPTTDALQIPNAALEIRNLRMESWSQSFNCVCKAGDIIFVDGPPGCGKTTLLSILGGLQPAPHGRVRILGHIADRLPQKVRRQQLGVAFNIHPLMQASLAANISYRLREPLDRAEISGLMIAVGLGKYLTATGTIVRKMLRDDGSGMPQADVDTVKLVRALVGKPEILILDGVLDHLDEDATENISRLLAGWPGLVMISSKLPQWRTVANRHWCLDGATIVDRSLPISGTDNVVALGTNR